MVRDAFTCNASSHEDFSESSHNTGSLLIIKTSENTNHSDEQIFAGCFRYK